MSTGVRFKPVTIFNAQATTGTTAYTSATIDMSIYLVAGLQVVYGATAGSMNGTLVLNGSNDGVNFTTLGLTITNPSGTDLKILIPVNGTSLFPYRYMNVVYTNSSGTGTITATLCAKDLG